MKMTKCLEEAKEKGYTHCKDNASPLTRIDDYLSEFEEETKGEFTVDYANNSIRKIQDGYMEESWVVLYKANLFDSMYEYAKHGDFTHFHKSSLEDKEYAIDSVKLYDQPDTIFSNPDDYPSIDGYTHVNAGEDEEEVGISYLKNEALNEVVWFVYMQGHVISPALETKKDAEKWLDKNID